MEYSISKEKDLSIIIFGKLILFLLLNIWSYKLLFQNRPWIFLDGINLLFHEAGHLLFAFGGQFISLFGGTIAQLSIPFIIGVYFLIKQKYFEVYFSLFWLGDNLINISTYIKDAKTQTLNLVGGGIHDWNFILTHMNLLSSDKIIGYIVFYVGAFCLISSIFLMLFSVIISTINKLELGSKVPL